MATFNILEFRIADPNKIVKATMLKKENPSGYICGMSTGYVLRLLKIF